MLTSRPASSDPLPRPLSGFAGRWRLTRQIRDFAGGPDGRFDGRAVFAPADRGLIYREEGVLTLGGARVRAERSYIWREAGEGVDVCFPDGRFFHRIGPGPTPEAEHDCPPDTYRVAYDFAAWPEWRAVWRVTGPRKDYESRSLYAPCGTGQGGAETDITGYSGTEDLP